MGGCCTWREGRVSGGPPLDAAPSAVTATLARRGRDARVTTYPTGCLRHRGAGTGAVAAAPLAALAGARGLPAAHDLPAGRRPGRLLRRLPAGDAGHPA